MGSLVYHVHADWDSEAGVWVATSDDVPGLATEAPTVEALSEKLRTIVPELLESNQLLSSGGGQPDAIAFELTSHRQERIPPGFLMGSSFIPQLKKLLLSQGCRF